MKLKIISAKTLLSLYKRKDILLVDLRDASDYAVSHISGAVWMDWETIEETLPDYFVKNHHSPDNISWIVLYCDQGNISLLTARDLARLGYPSMSLSGGFARWNGPIDEPSSFQS